MNGYKRLTKWSELGTLHIFDFNGKEISLYDVTSLDCDNLAGRLSELEDKIESGELDYVADKDKEIERLTAENAELRATLSKMETVEKELRERLGKAVDKTIVSEMLAKYFDCPCNFSPLDEEMWAYCRDNCVDDNIECWIRVINKKCAELKGEKE